jgi:hypothetical protein
MNAVFTCLPGGIQNRATRVPARQDRAGIDYVLLAAMPANTSVTESSPFISLRDKIYFWH